MQQAVHLCHDGSFDGFLTAVFEAYRHKGAAVRIYARACAAQDLFARRIEIVTEPEKAQRVFQKLQLLWQPKGLRYVLTGALYEGAERDDVLFAVIAHAIAQAPRPVLGDFGHAAVLQLSQWVKMVNRETHRMKAFVRFAKTDNGTYCAPIAPDFDVLPLIAPFFKHRYADQDWLIADVKRGYAVHYQKASKTLQAAALSGVQHWQDTALDSEEPFYQRLWRNYFAAANIQERANAKLHRQQVPVRYWRYLTEKAPQWY